jgi:hypothetical protein
MGSGALEDWYALPDRLLHITAGDIDIEASNIESAGLTIPGKIIRRIRRLRLRVQITLHPHSKVKLLNGF